MSDVFVKFNIRYITTLIEIKIKLPEDLSELTDSLKNELKLEETDELMILYPSPCGKMIQLQSDDDFNFLKETKLAYDIKTNEISCKVELLLNVIQNLPDGTIQLKILSKKINDLTFKVDKLINDFITKTDDITNSIHSNMRSILADFNLRKDSGNKSKNNFTGKFEKPNVISSEVDETHFEINLDENQKNTEEDKEKLSSATNNDSSAMLENKTLDISTPDSSKAKDFDALTDMLAANGYNHYLLNVIALKRFDENYEKTLNYLKTHPMYNKSP